MFAETLVERLLDLYRKHPRVAIFMSGSGSNAKALLSDPKVREYYDVVAIFSDNPDSNAQDLARQFDVKYHCIKASFHNTAGRVAYFDQVKQWLEDEGIQAIFYAGFMKIVTAQVNQNFPGVNVHPADLTIKDSNGQAAYRGMAALKHMAAQESYIACTFHLVDDGVDTGLPIAVSKHILLSEAGTSDPLELHTLLKTVEHQLYPASLVKLAKGEMHIKHLPLTEAKL